MQRYLDPPFYLTPSQVTKVSVRFAKVQILCVGDIPLTSDFPGVIRQGDGRLTNIDQVEIYKCFRPGDIVRAEVVRHFFLSF